MKKILTCITVISLALAANAKVWTLQECIDYALQNNITLKKNVLSHQMSLDAVEQARAALLPSISASTSQNMTYTPFTENLISVMDGQLFESSTKASYNGTYGVNAKWNAWDGNKNHNTVKQKKIAEQQADLQTQISANSIQEQIAQVYIQILYSKEAVKVHQQMLDISKQNLSRGQEMYKVGTKAKADVVQLESLVASDEYNLVNSETQVASYKLKLKQLLEIAGTEDFDVIDPASADAQALAPIPALNTVYETALAFRPEIQNSELTLQSNDLDIKIAKAGYLPTVSVSGSLGSNTNSRSQESWGKQMKTTFNTAVGLTVSVPIFDNKQAKTAVNKAKLTRQQNELELESKKKDLWKSIETYWLDATNYQAKFKSSQVSVKSAQASYELLSEQYRVGLKNISDILDGKSTLLQQEQNKLQNKYMTILDIQLLKFYEGDPLTM